MPKILLSDFRGGMIRDVEPVLAAAAPREKLGVRELSSAVNVVITDEGKIKGRNGFRFLADVPNFGYPRFCVQYGAYFFLYTSAGFFKFNVSTGLVEIPYPVVACYDAVAIDDTLYLASLTGIQKYDPSTYVLSPVSGSPSGQTLQLIFHRDRLWTWDSNVPNVVQATAIGDYEDWTNGYSVELYGEGENCVIAGLASVGDDLFILTDQGIWVLSGYGESSFSLFKLSASFRTTSAKLKTFKTSRLSGFGECVMFVDRESNVCAANRGGAIKVCEGYGTTRPASSATANQWATFLAGPGLYLVTASEPVEGSLSESLFVASVHCSVPFRAKSGKTQWPVTQFKTTDTGASHPCFLATVSCQLYTSVPSGTEMALLFFMDSIDTPTKLKLSTFFQCNRDTTGFIADDYFDSKYSQVQASIMLPPMHGQDREPRRWIEMKMTTGKIDSAKVTSLTAAQYMDETKLYPQLISATVGSAGTRTQNQFSFLLYGFSEITQLALLLYQVAAGQTALPHDHSMEVYEITVESE